ncbi:MAG: phosphatidylserine/phosphatidylglycerophosphate/cardiolipin synthase family protein [Proteobacteria bacterium]|nr:phosphatidylserine/phosphatidylglycerophosphate/cardiolipin synthase family protein [Pseudomonadota bacterium]
MLVASPVKRMWNLFILLSALANKSCAKDLTLSEIQRIYARLPGSYIVPEAAPGLREPVFSEIDGTLFPKDRPASDTAFSQGLFETDVQAFNRSMRAPDFLTAKELFFSSLAFNHRTQRHERPYPYLNGWFSLNHPPLKKTPLALENYIARFDESQRADPRSPFFAPSFQRYLDSTTGTTLSFDNRLHLLQNGDAIRAKIRLVNDSRKYVLGAVMAFSCDPSSIPLFDALASKARSGVPVYLMIERFYGAGLFKRCAKRLRHAGVRLLEVNDKWKRDSRLSFFHAKFWVGDGREAVLGGQNIAVYENLSTGYNALNRDTDVEVTGPAAIDLASEFVRLWKDRKIPDETLVGIEREVEEHRAMQERDHLRGASIYSGKLGSGETRMRGVCRVLVQDPMHRNLSIAEVLKAHVLQTRRSIFITTPEVKFNLEPRSDSLLDSLYLSLVDRARAGVPVEFLSNGLDGGNGELTAALRMGLENSLQSGRPLRASLYRWILGFEPANNARDHRRYLTRLHETPNFRTWTHFNYIHAKLAYLDRTVTFVSSLNLDRASVDRNTEAGILCMDEHLSGEMEPQLALDFANSVPVTSSNEFSQTKKTSSARP